MYIYIYIYIHTHFFQSLANGKDKFIEKQVSGQL